MVEYIGYLSTSISITGIRFTLPSTCVKRVNGEFLTSRSNIPWAHRCSRAESEDAATTRAAPARPHPRGNQLLCAVIGCLSCQPKHLFPINWKLLCAWNQMNLRVAFLTLKIVQRIWRRICDSSYEDFDSFVFTMTFRYNFMVICVFKERKKTWI